MKPLPKVVIQLKPGGHAASVTLNGVAVPAVSYEVRQATREPQRITITLIAEVAILPPEDKQPS